MAESTPYLAVKSISLSRIGGRKPCNLHEAARHNLREIQAELGAYGHIDPACSTRNIVFSGPAKAGEVQALADLLLAKAAIDPSTLRRDHCQAIEMVFSLPPQHGIGDPDAYFKSCLQWAQNALRLPILSAVIHHDEAAPHCHVLLLPVRESKHVGSTPIGRIELKKLRSSFFEKVAGPAGMKRPNAKVHGTVKRWVTDAVLHHCHAMELPSACGPLWPFFQHCIKREPTEAMQLLGICIESVRPKEEGSISSTLSPIGIESAPARIPTTVAASPIGIELEAEKNRTLSCVGFTPSMRSKPHPRAITSLNELWSVVGCNSRHRSSRLHIARVAEQNAIARHYSKPAKPAPPPTAHVDEDGFTRVRDEFAHDLSAWD